MPPRRPALPRSRTAPLVVVAVALLLALLAYAQQSTQQRAELQTQAELVARLAAAALVFDQPSDARETLAALGQAPAVVAATLRRTDGTAFAGFTRHAPAYWIEPISTSFRLVVPVVVDGGRIGTLELHATRAPMWQAVLAFVLTAWGVLAAAWGLTRLANRRLQREVQLAHAHLSFMAHHDSLTRLANREAFAAELHEAIDADAGCALMLVDLDLFKQINDLKGHAAGDHALRTVANRLRSLVGERGFVARQGGDEFAVLLRGHRDADELASLASAIGAALRQPMSWNGAALQVGASIGVASVPDDAQTGAEAMARADAALYQAKRSGRNHFARYSRELDQRQRERQRLIEEFGDALGAGDQLALHYQPVFDAKGSLASWEALCRWHHPQRGWIAPALFIPAAEESGLIVELGLAILALLRHDLDGWQAQGLEPAPVAVNLSSHQFRSEQDQTRFMARLRELGLDPDQVEFELTESAVFEDLDNPRSVIRTLEAQGFRLALDDFGTGYSSLGYLRRIRLHKLKIDRLFVTGVGRDQEAANLVAAVIGVAAAIGMKVVAEGIEHQRDQRCLQRLGCDYYQGFGLQRPLDAHAAAAFMRTLAAGGWSAQAPPGDSTLSAPLEGSTRH